MSKPTATYRLQLREGMTFARAAELAPYLASLGISHVYLSPIFRAVPGSTHGYDATDFNEIEPEVGGLQGYSDLVEVLAVHGLQIIIDFVPNHMAASTANPWWRDVLEWGAASEYAQHFDVDWAAPKLIVPVLAQPYGATINAGDVKLYFDGEQGSFLACYNDLALPLNPKTYSAILTKLGDAPTMAELALRFASSNAGIAAQLKRDLAAVIETEDQRQVLDEALAELQDDPGQLHSLLEDQTWRLAHWRTSRESLTYRRFFEISDLVGVRVEQPHVFDDVHRTVLDLIRQGKIHGLRIDHIDGLADPLGYLRRLRDAIDQDDFYIVVEKILGHNEQVRANWPIAGTTGYEFITDLASLFVNRSEPALNDAYQVFTGTDHDTAADTLTVKRRTLTRNLAGELDVLTAQALALAQEDLDTRDFGSDTLRRAIIEIASQLRVYRTYVDAAGPSAEDLDVLSAAATSAKASREVDDETAIDFIVSLLTLAVTPPARQAAAIAFAVRFQQTTGPLMAKAVEDTQFYRFNRLIALNEVGGEPQQVGGTLGDFHAAMLGRQRHSPHALTTTATHDTKRGEDARTRIYAISEAPQIWSAATLRWTTQLASSRMADDGGTVPDREMEWLFYQSLAGAWPASLATPDEAALAALADRMAAYIQKAAREAKLHTSWTRPDTDYEEALQKFVRSALDRKQSAEFLADFTNVIARFIPAGAITSLTQLTLKLAAPGIPDIYQGCELWDFSLVDPDNRSPVDYTLRRGLAVEAPADLAARIGDWSSGALKLRLTQSGLRLRNTFDFSESAYVALDVSGPMADHIVAFARIGQRASVVVVGLRFAFDLVTREADLTICPAIAPDTIVTLPPSIADCVFVDAFTGRPMISRGGQINLSVALDVLPVALLYSSR